MSGKMPAKSRKSSATVRKSNTSSTILPKKVSTASKEFKGVVNDGEFSYNLRTFCIECNTSVIPNVKVIYPEELREDFGASYSSYISKSDISSVRQQNELNEAENALASIPEVLAVQDVTTTSIVEVIFRQFQVDRKMLVALTKTLRTGTFIRSLKLEFCFLTSKEITALHLILRMIDTLREVSVDGNPNHFQNFHLLLKDTKVESLSLRFCGVDKIGAKKIAEEIKPFPSQTPICLNLSSNFLGDEGVADIADALRVNRSLLILNLADNQITDKGCEKIVAVLQRFSLNEGEAILRRKRILAYLKRKQEMIEMCMLKSRTTVSTGSVSKKSSNSLKKLQQEIQKEKAALKAASVASSKTGSIRSKTQSSKSEFEKMEYVNETNLPPDMHPFVRNTKAENRELYCSGNEKLMSLNLAYNKITQVGLRMIIQMLLYQQNNFPQQDYGLLRLTLIGNVAPNCCSEMNEILDLIAQKSLSMSDSVSSRNKSVNSLNSSAQNNS